jgi:hypothetical protein
MGHQGCPAHAPLSPGVRRDETIATLCARLRDATQQITQLQGKLDAPASVTANLYHENQPIRRQLGRRHASTIAVLPAAG